MRVCVLLGLLVASGPAALALEAAAAQPSLSLVSKARNFGKGQEVGAADSGDDEPVIPTVTHDKVKGNGYAPGSPLYAKQQQSGGSGGMSAEEAKNMPVSTTLQCICNLCLQYFAIYTALMVVKGINLLQKSSERSPIELIIEAATYTVAQAPMLCVLFLGTRMRAIQITGGQTEKYGLPQWWVQGAMQVCTYCVLGQLIMVFVLPVFTGQMPLKDGEIVPTPNRTLRIVLEAIRFTFMIGLYGGAVTVVVGIHAMEVPTEVHPSGEVPVSPAVQCTIALTSLYFITYFCFELTKAFDEMQNPNYPPSKLCNTFKLATYTVAFCPMLCVLFIGARMRALSMGLSGPQAWAQYCFYACTCAVWTVTLLVILVPILFGIRPKEGQYEGDISFESSNSESQLMAAKILAVIRWVVMVLLYIGFTAVMVSTLTIEHPKGPEHTPPLAPAMLCVTIFTVQYFTIFLLIWIVVTVKQFMPRGDSGRSSQDTFLQALFAAKDSVMAAPMLSVLFLGARMRALQITNNKGAPQGWAQDCMFLCVVSVMLQAILAIVTQFLAPKHSDRPDGGNKAAAGVALFQFVLMLTMHGGGLAVIVSVFLITPETANGRGSMLMNNMADTTP